MRTNQRKKQESKERTPDQTFLLPASRWSDGSIGTAVSSFFDDRKKRAESSRMEGGQTVNKCEIGESGCWTSRPVITQRASDIKQKKKEPKYIQAHVPVILET